MASPTIKFKVPKKASKGEVIEIKTTIGHDMESGQRKDKEGNKIPRKIINKFVASYNGKEVMSADWHPAVSANPYLAFFMRVDESGTLEMKWVEDGGAEYVKSTEIAVG